jgi:molybdopterin-guanine dinucleotide biosynthesis protein A
MTIETGMNISAVLLAGGESRRMGKDKATLSFCGTPLWRIQLELLRRLEPAEIFVSARTDPSWRPADVHLIADVPPSRGPISGIAAVLPNIHTTHLLALAVDMPLMSELYLRDLCREIGPSRGIVPQIHSRVEPLAAIYPREAASDFQNALAGSDFSLQTLVRALVRSGKLQQRSVARRDEKLFRNVNKLSDLTIR